MRKHILTFGEIMLRLKAPDFQRLVQARQFEAVYGGTEANVAVSLAGFGMPVEYITRLPANDLGEACLGELRRYGVGTGFILRGGDRLGIYYLEVGAAQRPSKVIYDRSNSAFASIQPGMVPWDAALQNAGWFHWTGITPAVSEGAAKTCEEGILAAQKAGLTISCDLNHRAKLWNWTKAPGDVMSSLVSHCTIAIGNEEDAEKVFGIKADRSDVAQGKIDPRHYQGVCEKLAVKIPSLKTIAITLRGSFSASHNSWSGVLWHGGTFYTAPIYDIQPIVDRVGAGDAFSAGLIYGLQTFEDDAQRALNFAVAASCLKHSIPGDFNQVSVAEVELLMSGNLSGRVVR